jgi:hypothetical protein
MPAVAGISSYNRKREPGSRFRTNKDGNPRMNKDGNPRMNKEGNTH